MDGDWSNYRIHVVNELERQNNNDEALDAKIAELDKRLTAFEKTCLQKEGDQKVDNAETRLKIYYIDFLIGGGASLLVLVIQWVLTTQLL